MHDEFAFLDAIHDFVYIADVDTYEIVYMNTSALHEFHLTSYNEVRGKLCYEAIRGQKAPCADCTNSRLNVGEFYVWRTYNPVLAKNFILKDTLIQHKGRTLRLEAAFDVSEIEELQRANLAYVTREVVLNKGIERAITEKTPVQSIKTMLSFLGAHFQSDRAYLFEVRDEGWSNTYEWCAPRVTPQKDFLQNIRPSGGLEGWIKLFNVRKQVIIEDVESIKASEPQVYAILAPQDVRDLVAAPIFVNGKLQAFFGLDNPSVENLYDISNFLGIAANFFAYLLERRNAVRTLEETVALRTKALEESRQQALDASTAKSAFLSTVSHEIRTPMNAIMGYIHLFERDNLTTAQLAQLDKISAASTVLLNLINDVLDISKIESGRLELESRAFPLAQCIDVAQAIIAPLVGGKDVAFIVNAAANLPETVAGDVQRLDQVLINILNNAVKFTTSGSVTFSITCRDPRQPQDIVDASPAPRDEQGRVLLGFRIQDTGIGIDPAKLEKIFEPFVQADNSITRRFGGSGLGLCISKKVIEGMDGHIRVTSVPGEGSTFDVIVPLPMAQGVRDTQTAGRQSLWQGDAGEALTGTRLLLVEDNLINQDIAVAMLEKYGIDVVLAGDGRQALDILQKDTKFDGILMDVQMPVMDGIEATRHIRSMGREGGTSGVQKLVHLPIIAMTANALQEDKNVCMDAGMTDYISKPIEPDKLKACLLRYFATGHG